jgi:electron transport complex protein RnfB
MLIEAIIVLGALALFFGFVIGIVAKRYAIEEKDPKIKKVLEILPGMNCGACGFASCEAVAEAIVKGKINADVCVFSKRNKEIVKKIQEILEET